MKRFFLFTHPGRGGVPLPRTADYSWPVPVLYYVLNFLKIHPGVQLSENCIIVRTKDTIPPTLYPRNKNLNLYLLQRIKLSLPFILYLNILYIQNPFLNQLYTQRTTSLPRNLREHPFHLLHNFFNTHVTEGEKIARRNHLPEVVINFITTHHGTSLVRYFYNTYCNAHPNEKVDESLFRYPGAKPSTKEGAILMMADAIEARSRSLEVYTEESISKAVNQMIDVQIADGQYAETPLSFKDVEDIRRVFVSRLVAMNHHRISYPTLNK